MLNAQNCGWKQIYIKIHYEISESTDQQKNLINYNCEKDGQFHRKDKGQNGFGFSAATIEA